MSTEGLDLETLKTIVSVFITLSAQKRSSCRNEEEACLGLVRSCSAEGREEGDSEGGVRFRFAHESGTSKSWCAKPGSRI